MWFIAFHSPAGLQHVLHLHTGTVNGMMMCTRQQTVIHRRKHRAARFICLRLAAGGRIGIRQVTGNGIRRSVCAVIAEPEI